MVVLVNSIGIYYFAFGDNQLSLGLVGSGIFFIFFIYESYIFRYKMLRDFFDCLGKRIHLFLPH